MKKKTQTTNTAGYRRKATTMTTYEPKYYRFVAKDITTNEVVKSGRLCQRRCDATANAEAYYNAMVDTDASIRHWWHTNRQSLSAVYGNIYFDIVIYNRDKDAICEIKKY